MLKRRTLSILAVSALLLVVGTVFFLENVAGASYTWDGGGSDGTCGGGAGDGNKWSCALNWSTDTVPGPSDNAIFDGTSSKDATIDSSFAGTVSQFIVNSGYTGTITQERSFTASSFALADGSFDADSSGITTTTFFAVTGGTFNGSTGDLDVGTDLNVNTGVFNMPTGITTVDNDFNAFDGQINTTGGGMTVARTLEVQDADADFGSMNYIHLNEPFTDAFLMDTGTGTFTAPIVLNVNRHFTQTAGTFDPNGGTINFNSDDITCTSLDFSASTVNFNQSTWSDLEGGCTVNLGSNPTLDGGLRINDGLLTGTGTLTTTNGAGLAINDGAGLSGFTGIIANSDFFTGTTASVNMGSFSPADFNEVFQMGGSSSFVAPSGTMTVSGTLFTKITGTFTHNDGTVIFDNSIGETTQVTGFASGVLNDVQLNHAGEVEVLNAELPIGGFATSSGGLDLGNNGVLDSFGSLIVNGDMYIEGTAANPPDLTLINAMQVNGDLWMRTWNGDPNIPSLEIDVNGNLTIENSVNFDAPNNTYVSGDITISNEGYIDHGNNNFILDGTNQTIEFENGPGYLDTSFYNLTKSVTSADTLYLYAGREMIVEGTLTLTGTSGNELSVESTDPGERAFIRATGPTSIDYVELTDIHHTDFFEIEVSGANVDDGGNNFGFDFVGTAQPEGEFVYALDPFADTVRLIDTESGDVSDEQTLDAPGYTILGSNGADRDPLTCTMYGIHQIDGQSGRSLSTIDPETGDVSIIGNTGLNIADIAFDGTGQLFAITGYGDPTNPESLYSINTTTAAATFLADIGNDDESEALAFNSNDGFLYHFSGYYDTDYDDVTLQTVNTSTYATSDVPVSGALGPGYDNVYSIAYMPDTDVFVGAQYDLIHRFGANGEFQTYAQTSDGESAKGMVLEECDLPAYSIQNLDSGIGAQDVATGLPVGEPDSSFSTAGRTIRLTDSPTTRVFADVPTDLTADRDWMNITGGVNVSEGKVFAHNVTTSPGAGASYSLYVPIPGGASSSSMVICPDATNLSEVSYTCSNAVTFTDGQTQSVGGDTVTVTKQTITGNEYWRAEGVTGTGGISLFDDFNLRDTLTRLEVSQPSDHTIDFGSVNDTDNPGDTIVIDFDDAWDFTGLTVADVDLEDDGVDKALAATPGADIWGLVINTSADTLTFTAPTSGTDYIAASSLLVVKIGTVADGGSNQITNPGTVNSYEIDITITNNDGTETGEAEIPIIDDDTVNVSGFIDTFISFDIDTSETDEDCDASGGASPCDSHGGSSDNAGYVIDLGELNTSQLSDSGDTVTHADGQSGEINSIYFDLSTNAVGGAVVTVLSLNGELSGPSSAAIPSVGTGSEIQITAGSGLYGINSFGGLVNSATTGAATVNDNCDGDTGNDYYCAVTTSATEIFNTSSAPIDSLRIEWEVGATPDSLDATGTYTDQLTFIATATF